MPGKETPRKTQARDVYVKVDGQEVELNGFVMDVFQEVVTGLVRSLGDVDAESAIEVTIGARS